MSGKQGPDPEDPSGAVRPVKFHLSPRHLEILDELVRKTGRSRSGVVRALLERAKPADPVQGVARRALRNERNA